VCVCVCVYIYIYIERERERERESRQAKNFQNFSCMFVVVSERTVKLHSREFTVDYITKFCVLVYL